MKTITRREAIVASLACATLARADEPYSDIDAAAAWLAEWEAGKRATHGMLHVMRFADPTYVVTKEIGWTPEPRDASKYPAVTVPVGFVTDFASIPRAFWSLLRPDGDYCYAAIIHDFLYWDQHVEREQADQIFRLVMREFNVGRVKTGTIYRAVRTGGGVAWKSNRELKEAGERRILKRLPSDPTTRWADWKKLDDVF